MSRRRICIGLILLATLASLPFAAPRLFKLWWYREVPNLVPHSDVPITRDLVYAPRTPEVEVLEMTVKGTTVAHVKEPGGGCRFILQTKLRCRVNGKPPQEGPLIERAQITARQVKRGDFGDPSAADIDIHLIAGTREDPAYVKNGPEITITLEDIVDALSMGRNIYQVHCGGHTGTVELEYDPKGPTRIVEK